MQDVSLQNTGPTFLDGTTFELSLPLVTGASTLLQAGSPARTSAMQDGEKELKEPNPVCGQNSIGSFAFYDRNTCSWRTWQLCLDGELEEWSATWPNAGMTRNGIAFPVPPSVPFISGIGSFFWPTPTVNGDNNRKGASAKSGDGLATAVRRQMVPTPRASPNENRQTKPSPSQLAGKHGMNLATWVNMYTTPSADDTGHRKKRYSQGGEALSFQVGGPLNPPWVEWLMGFPVGWTDLDVSETP